MFCFFLTVRHEYAYARSLGYAMGHRAKNPPPGLFVPCLRLWNEFTAAGCGSSRSELPQFRVLTVAARRSSLG